MEVIHVDTAVKTKKQQHTCDVCLGQGEWTSEWMWTFIVFGNKYNKSEYTFKICSYTCHQKVLMEGLLKKKKKELNGCNYNG